MTNAAQQGQQMQTDEQRGAAEAGLGPAGGASGGADIFAGAAGASAQGNLQRTMQSNLMQAMLPIAQQLVSDRMQAWLGDRERVLGQTTKFQDIMGAVNGLSSSMLTARQGQQATQGTGSSVEGSNVPGQPNFIGPEQPNAMTPASSANMTAQPAGTMAAVGPSQTLAMPNTMAQSNMPGMRQGGLQSKLSGMGGRFARAMSARNRFGAVQTAFGS